MWPDVDTRTCWKKSRTAVGCISLAGNTLSIACQVHVGSEVQDAMFFAFVCCWFGGFIPCIPQKMCLDDKLQLSKLAQKVRQVPFGTDGTWRDLWHVVALGRQAGHKRITIIRQKYDIVWRSMTLVCKQTFRHVLLHVEDMRSMLWLSTWFRGCLACAVRPGIEPLEMRSLGFTSTEWSWFTSRGQMPMTC
jgi:hypothetical protein